MATALLKCRVCGKEYEGCRTAQKVDGVFRWKEVSCSPECGAIYLERIRKSRAKTEVAVAQGSAKKKSTKKKALPVETDMADYAVADTAGSVAEA